MPVNKHLAESLKKQYGDTEGEKAYYAMENSSPKSNAGKTFKKGLKTAKKEGHTVAHFPSKKKKA